jgi:hypothetical protein
LVVEETLTFLHLTPDNSPRDFASKKWQDHANLPDRVGFDHRESYPVCCLTPPGQTPDTASQQGISSTTRSPNAVCRLTLRLRCIYNVGEFLPYSFSVMLRDHWVYADVSKTSESGTYLYTCGYDFFTRHSGRV